MNKQTQKNKFIWVKAVLLIAVLAISAALLWILKHQAMTERAEEVFNPIIVDAPLYVECKDGNPVEIRLTPSRNMSSDYLNILFVNTSEDGKGRLEIKITDADGVIINESIIDERNIPVGSWNKYDVKLALTEGEDIIVTLLAHGCNPYMIQAPLTEMEGRMPFAETVSVDGANLDTGVSLGLGYYYDRVLTYSDIFYWSDYIVLLFAALAIACILLGGKGVMDIWKVMCNTAVPTQYANDLCLLAVWLYTGLSIFKYAYADAVCISADSAGYLREAANLCAGNGFSYDGLAGYSSWFANWPILYPLMIAAIAGISGLDMYIASKILSVILIGAILLLLRLVYKRNAWIYSLALLNLGFIEITQYTWSETPFMLFILAFGIVLAKILSESEAEWYLYAALALSYAGAYLTRYFGIFLIALLGLAVVMVFLLYLKTKELNLKRKCVGLTAVAIFNCLLTTAYMLINKVNNGKASGVSRNMWWDDVKSLTNDLIQSLLTEFFNAFGIEVPVRIDALPYGSKALILLLITCVIAWIAGVLFSKQMHLTGNSRSIPNIRELVLIVEACIYYGMFIVIRYRSSMDTFYFRFFEPASFLLTIGLLGLISAQLISVMGKSDIDSEHGGHSRRLIPQLIMLVMLVVMSVNLIKNTKWDYRDSYYGVTTRAWDEAYKEIPHKSVVIFNALDYRSEYYRPDVVGGVIEPQDTLESLWSRYYGSEYLCVSVSDAQVMVEEGEYLPEIKDMLSDGLRSAKDKSYIVIKRN